ncbi:MAG TPA: hypothetical protein VGU02_12400 [Gaiellaceae bacterium]|nr:hypothetical protein [Gaiellaceae bacterium]
MTGAVTAAALALATTRPQLSLVAEPARVQIDGTGSQTITVANRGSQPVVLDVQRAGFALDLRGQPRIVAAARAAWLSVRPKRVAIAAGSAATVTVRATVPRGARPGDHASLLLLGSRPLVRGAVAVRMRLGVVVVLRVPGRVVHRLAVLRVRARQRLITVRLANRGNVAEQLTGGRVVMTLWRRGKEVGRAAALPRELLPGATGDIEFRYRGPLRGPVIGRLGRKPPGPPFRLVL